MLLLRRSLRTVAALVCCLLSALVPLMVVGQGAAFAAPVVTSHRGQRATHMQQPHPAAIPQEQAQAQARAHPEASTTGSLRDALDRRLSDHEAQQQSAQHSISPSNQAKAAAFISHLDQLVAGLKAKSHLARLSHKYPAFRSAAENATLAHEEAEAEAKAQEVEYIDGEEDEFGRSHAPQPQPMERPSSAPRNYAHRHRHRRAYIPGPSNPDAQILDRVPPTYLPRGDLRWPRPVEAASDYVLHSISLAPTSGSPSGLNFTTFVYPTIQGNVTIFVGIVEYPLGKFHFYPSPRDTRDEIDMFSLVESQRADHARAERLYAAQQAKAARSSMAKHNGIITAFLEENAILNARLNPLCDGIATTSVSARSYGCLLAQNAGFFNMQTHACMGNIVSADQWINHATPDLQTHSHFGMTRSGNFVTGYMTADEAAAGVDGGFHELTQGSGWLVRDGVNYLSESSSIENLDAHFVTEKAPRNAVGHDRNGRLLMFEADGEEDIDLGLTLAEFADILSHHFDVENAINVDGGGSSTTVYKGEVVDRPTCRDTPDICERAVTTISCVMP